MAEAIRWVVQIVVLACVYYYLLLFFRGTRATQILVGLGIVAVTLIGLTRWLRLDELNWLLSRGTPYAAVALAIAFQPEVRKALAEVGRQPFLGASVEEAETIDQAVRAMAMLSEQRVGAMIAFEREIGTREVQSSGVALDARVTAELLASLFYPHTPLHDGGAIIRGNRIVAAGCVFPLSQRVDRWSRLGTRHRAGLGLSEETDAVVVVVSEETGTISLCYRGRMSRGLTPDQLRRVLAGLLLRRQPRSPVWKRLQERLDFVRRGPPTSPDTAEEGTDG